MLNQPAPDFELADTTGKIHRLGDYLGRIVVVNFWSAECLWSERADKNLMAVMNQIAGEKLAVLVIASNQNETPQQINEAMLQRGLKFVLRDEGARAARVFQAQTTPHAFVIDSSGILRYHGAVDDVTFRKRTASRWYVEEAVEALLDGRLPEVGEVPPYGCTIVWQV
jgi:peroxiredoxin